MNWSPNISHGQSIDMLLRNTSNGGGQIGINIVSSDFSETPPRKVLFSSQGGKISNCTIAGTFLLSNAVHVIISSSRKNLGRALLTAILDGVPIALPFFSPGE